MEAKTGQKKHQKADEAQVRKDAGRKGGPTGQDAQNLVRRRLVQRWGWRELASPQGTGSSEWSWVSSGPARGWRRHTADPAVLTCRLLSSPSSQDDRCACLLCPSICNEAVCSFFQHVDTGNSYLCGYLKIKGLTEVSTHFPDQKVAAPGRLGVRGRRFALRLG